MATGNELDLDDGSFLRAILLGVVVGVSAMFVVSTGIVVLGGQSLAIAAGTSVWVGLVIGPYAGGLAMLSAKERRRSATVHQLPVADQEEAARRAS